MSANCYVTAEITSRAVQLRSLADGELNTSIYFGSKFDDVVNRYRQCVKDAVKYSAGAHLCDRYLYGSLNLEEFRQEMVNVDLHKFLIGIPHHYDNIAHIEGDGDVDECEKGVAVPEGSSDRCVDASNGASCQLPQKKE